MGKSRKTDRGNKRPIEPPLSPRQVKEKLKNLKATEELDVRSLDSRLLLGAANFSQIEKFEQVNLDITRRRINLQLDIPKIGEYRFPEDTKYNLIDHDDFVTDPDEFNESKGFRPQHINLNISPTRLPKSFQIRKNIFEKFPEKSKEAEGFATTIFGADNRMLFQDTSYPWGCCGLVTTPIGSSSGVMVGPRHLLTCSHGIQWNANSAGWIRFTPASFDGAAPFGTAWGTRVYYRLKVFGPSLSRNEMQHDYAVVVLDRRIGDLTGWMGTKSWSDSWDNNPWWAHVGYPGDLNGGSRPSYQGSISLDGSFWDRERHTRIFHRGDVWPGQSGGPFFAWWSNGPHAVAVQSAQNSDENTASGGSEMVDLVIRARNEWP